jgi:hypothetical protein
MTFSTSPHVRRRCRRCRCRRRERFPREHVSGVRGAKRREYDERIAVSVADAQVVKVDLIAAAAERQPVFVRSLRHELRVGALEASILIMFCSEGGRYWRSPSRDDMQVVSPSRSRRLSAMPASAVFDRLTCREGDH